MTLLAQGVQDKQAEVPLRHMHVDPLHPKHLRPLSQPFEIFDFRFSDPPASHQASTVQVCLFNTPTSGVRILP